jgi:hypothetical protein
MVIVERLTERQIPLSSKSPKNIDGKKSGRSILEKRADKKTKAENSGTVFPKPRKSQR